MGFPVPHCVSITKPHKWCGFFSRSAYLSLTPKYIPTKETISVNSLASDILRWHWLSRYHVLKTKTFENKSFYWPTESEMIFYTNMMRYFHFSGTPFVKQLEWLNLVWRKNNNVDSSFFYFSEWINDLLNTSCWGRGGFFSLFFFSFLFTIHPQGLHAWLSSHWGHWKKLTARANDFSDGFHSQEFWIPLLNKKG